MGYQIFGRKRKQKSTDSSQLMAQAALVTIASYQLPLVKLEGFIPPGSDGNSVIASIFRQILSQVDIQASQSKILIYDLLGVDYSFGDHVGAFLWVLPALVDGVSIMVAADDETRSGLMSLADFIGAWLPVAFFESTKQIASELQQETPVTKELFEKAEHCRRLVHTNSQDDTGLHIVLFGSRQTGWQYKSGKQWRKDSDMDFGTIGGPREIARLASADSRSMPNVEHPPTRLFSSAQEAAELGFLMIQPHRG